MINFTRNNQLCTLTVATLAAMALVGCGGGGGGSTPAPVQNQPPAVTGTSTLVTGVGAASYTGELADAFNLLNAERQNCGFGLLAQNAALDQSGNAHTNYLMLNGTALAHNEVAGQPGFTGVDPNARAAAAGYSGSAGEALAFFLGATSNIRGLLSAPYHERGLMDGYREVGLSYATQPQKAAFAVELGIPKNTVQQMPSSDSVLTYPCNGTAGVNRRLLGESPNPIPGRDLAVNPIGTPILVKVRQGQKLAVTSATLIKTATGAAVTLRAPIGNANDPNGYFQVNEAYIAPDAPLDANSQYQATIAGTNNGVAFSRTFTFSTGSF